MRRFRRLLLDAATALLLLFCPTLPVILVVTLEVLTPFGFSRWGEGVIARVAETALIGGSFIVPVALLLTGRRRILRVWRRWDQERSICAECGYDLRATPDRCPECGAVPARREEPRLRRGEGDER